MVGRAPSDDRERKQFSQSNYLALRKFMCPRKQRHDGASPRGLLGNRFVILEPK
ncbi:hypothetical protein D3C71_2252120 [compost metagenome]